MCCQQSHAHAPSPGAHLPFAETASIRDILARFPETAAVFARHGLVGCGGPAGPDEPLAFFARVHHVPLDALLTELGAALAGARDDRLPASTPLGGAVAVVEDRVRRYVPFFAASLILALSLGATLGMINLIRLTTALLGTLPRPSVWAHAYAQVFGFVGLFVMGMAYHVIPRFAGVALQSPRSAAWSLWLQTGGVVSVALAFLAPAPLSFLWLIGSISLVAASALFATAISRTLTSRRAFEGFEPWVIAGAGWLVVASALAVVAAIRDDTSWHHVLWPVALYGFAGSWIFGVGRRIFPVFIGWTPRSARWDRPVFLLYETGVLLWSAGAWPEQTAAGAAARGLGASALLAAVPAFTYRLGVFGTRESSAADPHRGYERYIFAAWAWLFVALATGPLWTIGALALGRYGSVTMLDFSRHALALGFVTQMIMGVASRVLPVFTGRRLWSTRVRTAGFWLINTSVGLRGLEALVATGTWADAWPLIALSGPPAVAALALFALNVTMTMKGDGAAERATTADLKAHPTANGPRRRGAEPPALADWVVADLLEIPSALEVMVAAGFAPLQNPALRAALARTVTLRQACRLKGVPLEPLVSRLTELRQQADAGRPTHAARVTAIPLTPVQ